MLNLTSYPSIDNMNSSVRHYFSYGFKSQYKFQDTDRFVYLLSTMLTMIFQVYHFLKVARLARK